MLNHAGERRNYQSSYWLDEAPGGLDPRLIFHSFESQLADNVGVTEGKGGPWHYK